MNNESASIEMIKRLIFPFSFKTLRLLLYVRVYTRNINAMNISNTEVYSYVTLTFIAFLCR